MQTQSVASSGTRQLVDIRGLIVALFAAEAKPSERTVRTWTKNRTIPSIKIGHLVFYDVPQVQEALLRRNTIKARQ